MFFVALFILLNEKLNGADSNPPEGLTYQGYLTDSSGTALGSSSPANYDAIFRIWSVKQGGSSSDIIWSEQQTITVDKGYFSILLGEGSAVGGEPRNQLGLVFQGSDASDRFVEVTVLGLADGDVTLAPRMKLVTSPYSFLSSHSRSSDRIVGTDSQNNSIDVLKTSGENVGIGLSDGASPNARLDVNGSALLRSNLSVAGKTNLEGSLAIGKGTAPQAALDVSGNAVISGQVTLGSNLTLSAGSVNVTP